MKKRFLAALVFLLPFYSQAQEAFYISGLLGLSSPSSEIEQPSSSPGNKISYKFGAEISYGFRLGLLFNDHLSAGIYTQRYSDSDTGSTSSLPRKGTFTNLMAEFNYYVNEADEDGFWFGGLLGITQVKLTNAEDNNETAFGVLCGYHFMVAPNFSIAPQITYIHTDRDWGEFAQFSGLVNLTFWM